MPYRVGVSSGWWKIGRDPALLGLAAKVAGFGGTSGVQFIQADLDTTSEFYEPQLKYQMKRVIKEMGMEVGIHAEVGELMALESSERRLWKQSHLRLIETVKHAADFGIIYVNIHLSEKPQLEFLEAQYRVTGYYYPVVSFDGKPLYTLCINDKLKKEALNLLEQQRGSVDDDVATEKSKELFAQAQRNLEEDVKKFKEGASYKNLVSMHPEETQRFENEYRFQRNEYWTNWARDVLHSPEVNFEMWKNSMHGAYIVQGAEIGAYKLVGEYMKSIGDPLWSHFCGSSSAAQAYNDKHPEFNAALACKYIEGHLRTKDDPLNKKHLEGMSIIEWLEKKNLLLLLEIPEAHEGTEGLVRLFNPLDAYYLMKKIGSPNVKLCIDFEHLLAHKLNPDDIIKDLPSDAGKQIFLFHLGKPIPYWGTAHIPVALGSRSQEIIYKWLYEIRKKGFTNGYMIFERGSGRSGAGKSPMEVMENSVEAIRQIAKYLDMDVKPDELPPEFYGLAPDNKAVYAREVVTIHEHAWDPLEGTLMIPDEKHTFFGRAAVDKGKAKEWEKEKFR